MVKQQIAKMEKAKKELEDIFDAIPNPLLIHGENFAIVRANKAYQKMTGMPFEKMIGKPYYEVFPKMEKPFKICIKEQELLEKEEAEEEVFLPDINKNYTVRLSPVWDVDYKYRRYLHILEDVTETKKAEEKVKREAAINRALLKVAEVLSTTFERDEIFRKVIEIVPTVINADRYIAFLYDRKTGAFVPVHSHGIPKDLKPHLGQLRLTRGMPIVDKMLKGETVIIEDACKNSLFPRKIAEEFRHKSVMAVPIISKQAAGMIEIDRIDINDPFGDREKAIVKGIASQMSIALENAALFEESMGKTIDLSRRIEMISVMHEIDRSILSTLEPQEILEKAATMISRLIPCDGVTVAMVDREKKGFVYVTGWGINLPEGILAPFNSAAATEGIKARRTELIQDLSQAEKLLPVEEHFLKEGFYSYVGIPIIVKDETIGVLSIGAKKRAAFTHENISTLEKLASQIAVAMENARLLADMKDLFIGTIKSLAQAIDAKSPWTKGHSDRVTEYALQMGKEMGLQDKELEDLRIAGLLHDIGKIGTHDTILDKPGKLASAEYEIVKKHPARASELLLSINQLSHIITWIRGHHERLDGTGYPDGLKGDEIPLQAKILAVADAFDAMTAERPYRATPG
ncbi:MAG: GAF domain-containing protein, partial [Nitrospinae bacterium]|nr:GAF domain-containing protein [Nitrospinota bacterium]